MAREYADTAFLTELPKRRVNPAEALNIIGVYADSDAHAGLTDPNVIGSKIVIEGEVLKNGVLGAQ